MKNIKLIPLILGLAFVSAFTYFIIIKNSNKKKNLPLISQQNIIKLQPKNSKEGGVSFTVKPLDFNFDNPVKFEIKIDTHSGSLDFDLTKISILEDDKGNQYKPMDWQGSSPGGHHRSGILVFPKIENGVERIKLTIQDELPRIFEWNLE